MKKTNIWAWLYIIPTLLILAFFLVYPAVNTLFLSFLDRKSELFVGFSNYIFAFTNKNMLYAFRNNLIWLVVFTAFTVSLGLILAILLDRVRYESVAKSIIFLPMAISFVGAGVIWKFIYAYRPAGSPQIGILNAVLSKAFNLEPVGWLINKTVNNFALIFAGVWIWVGFCMVILSAAYKGIPKELLEAARVDGANELQVFWRIILPVMKPTIAVVITTMIINVLKVFDIVYVMTNGEFGTEVVANRMFKEMFHFRNFGHASAIAVILLVAIIPVMIVNIRRFREQEALR
ncbi:MAG: sugar ABC transporter permease [Actinobacteria bacterium]|nr:sugar ABC transporter permease [Actinomycetota bacterium]